MDRFDWQRVNVYFPEWSTNSNGAKKEIYWENFTGGGNLPYWRIDFLLREYGVELVLPAIPKWLDFDETKVGEKSLKDFYKELSHSVHMSVVNELEGSFGILESWRKFVKRYNGREWVGNLADHLEFRREGERVCLFDYYSFGDGDRLTDKLVRIGNLPEHSLNDAWLNYLRLVQNIFSSDRKGTINSIVGLSISDCVKKADEIYQVADQLRDLKV